jgi:septal ring-binding cell division protein DamX
MKFQHLALIASSALLLSACAHDKFPRQERAGAYPLVVGCAGNHYLERYGCSLERLNAAARSGDADAQYGLGYMYYYGIGTIRNEGTAISWINKAADQGQPLAMRARRMMTGEPDTRALPPAISYGAHAPVRRGKVSLHQEHENVTELNNQKNDHPIQEQLPAYGKKKAKAPLILPTSHLNVAPKLQANAAVSRPIPNHGAVQQAPALNVAQKQQANAAQTPSKAQDPSLAANQKASSQAAEVAKTLSQGGLQKLQANSAPQSAESPKPLTQNAPQKPVQKAESIGQAYIPTTLSRNERWMMHNTGKHYSLQIMGGRDLASIKHFMEKNHLQGKAHYYSANLEGQKWYMLVYGDFKSEKQAYHASKKLPQNLRSHHPWVKSYAVIQKEIEERKIIS